MRVGILGCGSIGSRHARNIVALGHRVALYDENIHRQTQLMCEIGPENSDASFSDVEAYMICTPASTHAAVARELLAEGYSGPLFVEKPIAVSSKECDVFKAWPHPTTMVGYNLRFHHALRSLRAHVKNATGGRFFLDCDSQSWPGGSYAGMLLECSHEIDLALFCGAPSVVDEADGGEHEMSLWLSTGNGSVAEWHVALRDRMHKYHRQWSLVRRGSEADAFFYAPDELGDEMYRDEIAHFLDCAEKCIPTITPFSDGLRVLDVCEQAERMACLR